MPTPNTITFAQLSRLIGLPDDPIIIIDGRIDDDYARDTRTLPGAVRKHLLTASAWAAEFRGRRVAAICQRGQKLSQGAAAWLRHEGVQAESLEGGFETWAAAGGALVRTEMVPPRDHRGRTVWVTRARPKVDRIACPWLIRRFVDPSAVFLFVAPPEVEPVADRFGAAPFDVDGVFWGHRGELCTFDVMIQEFGLGSPALDRLALLVRGADTAEGMPALAEVTAARAWRAAAVWGALWLAPVAVLLLTFGGDATLTRIALFFTEMAVVTFGGAYAVLAYVAQQAVKHSHWLQPGEMLDGLGMAETTPGPLIMVTEFVGFMVAYRDPGSLHPMLAGTLGGLLTTWVTFTPCFLWIFLGAPFIERLRGNKALSGALAAITACVVGVILNLAVWFALHTWFRETARFRAGPLWFDAPLLASIDGWALALSAAAAVAIFRFKARMIPTLLACAAAGLVLHLAGAA